jgi:hypothetical protein
MSDEENYNFPNDREYTLNALVEEFNLAERHMRDGSFRLCTCTVSKHLPTIAGMSSEGMGFAASDEEARFMEENMNQARILKQQMKSGHITDEQAKQLRAWFREQRRRIEMGKWTGELPKTSLKSEAAKASFGKDITFPAGVDATESNGDGRGGNGGDEVFGYEHKPRKNPKPTLKAKGGMLQESRDDIVLIKSRPHSPDVDIVNVSAFDARSAFN